MAKRTARARSVPQRRVTRDLSRQATQPTQRTIITAKREEQATKKTLQGLSQDIKNVVESNITDVSKAEQQANKIIRENISNVDPAFRNFFISKVRTEARALANRQNKQISNLKNTISDFKKQEQFLRERRKEARERGRSIDIFTKRLKALRTKEAETENIIKRLERGERLDATKVSQFIEAKGRERKEKVSVQQERRQAQKEAETINNFIRKQTLLGETSSLSNIKDELGVSSNEARKIESSIKANIRRRERFLDSVKENAILGKKYTESELRGLGLTNKDIEEVRAVSSLESKRINSLLNEFGDNLIPPNNSKYYNTRNTAVLSKLQLDLLEKDLQQKKFKEDKFKKLQKRDKDIITAYNYLLQAKKEIPTQKQLNDLRQEARQLSGLTNLEKELKEAKAPAEVLDIVNSAFLIDDKDKNNLKILKSLSDKEIRNLLIKEDGLKLNRLISSFNRYAQNKRTTAKNRTTRIIDIFKNEIIKTTKIKSNNFILKKIAQAKPLLRPVLLARTYLLVRKQKQGEAITKEEFLDYKKQVLDPLGFKSTSTTFKKWDKKPKTDIRLYFEVTKFLLKTLVNTVISVIKIIKDLATIAFRTIRYTSRVGQALASDIYNASKRLIKGTRNKKKLFQDTKQELKPVADVAKAGGDIVKKVGKDPTLILFALAFVVAEGSLAFKKSLIKDPTKLVGEVLGFFYSGIVLQKIALAGKIVKAKFSPFVIRNVKVFEKAPTKITTAQALKSLQGKKVDIFTATGDDLKKLFRGASITAKERDLLIKAMKTNPNVFIGANKKIKSLDSIAKSIPKLSILSFMKKEGGILSGSSSLAVQLRRFRKVGDFDIIAKNAFSYGKKLVNFMNDKTWFGKIAKGKRFILRRNKRGVFEIIDRFTNKQVVDIVPNKQAFGNIKFILGRGFKLKKDTIKINGVRVLKVETQLPLKTALSGTTSASFRAEKELKDVKLILSKAQKSLKKEQYKLVKKLFDKNKNIVNIKGVSRGLGKDRKWFWVEKYGINFKKLKSSQIRARLKKLGFTQARIDRNINLYSPDGMYFGSEKVYPYFLGEKGGVIFIRQQKIAKFPKSLSARLKKNLAGQLTQKQKIALRKDLNRYIKKNADKVFPGEKALIDRVGEEEVIAPVYSRLFKRKTLIKREIWVPSLEKFVTAQEAVLGKPPLPLLKRLTTFFKGKVKGKSIKQLKKDITAWVRRNADDVLKKSKGVNKKTESNLKFIQRQQDLIDNEIRAIKKTKGISKTQKNKIISDLQRRKKSIIPKRRTFSRARIANAVRRAIKISRRKTKVATRKIKRAPRKPKRTARKAPRKAKVRTRKTTRKLRKATRVPKRVPIRARKVPRRARAVKTTAKKPPRRIKVPKIKLSFRKKLKRGENYLVNGRVRVKGKNRVIPLNTTLNRGFKRMIDLVDNSTARSFDIILIGITKSKDVKAPASLIKFRRRIGKNPQILKFVEKARFSIDTTGEKKGLKVSKLLKRGKNANKNKNTKVRKRKGQTSSKTKARTPKKRKVRPQSRRSTKTRNKKRSSTSKRTNKKRVRKRKRS